MYVYCMLSNGYLTTDTLHGSRSLTVWILRFCHACSVEYDKPRLRPVAWWVRYSSEEKQRQVVQTLGGNDSRLGVTDIFIECANREAAERDLRRTILKAGGKRVLLETEQEMTADKV